MTTVVVCAVSGECCDSTHIKFVRVSTHDPGAARLAARRYLEHVKEFDVGDCCPLPSLERDLASFVDYNIPMEETGGWTLQPGDEVYWIDREIQARSHMKKVTSVEFIGDGVVRIVEESGATVEVYLRDLLRPSRLRHQNPWGER